MPQNNRTIYLVIWSCNRFFFLLLLLSILDLFYIWNSLKLIKLLPSRGSGSCWRYLSNYHFSTPLTLFDPRLFDKSIIFHTIVRYCIYRLIWFWAGRHICRRLNWLYNLSQPGSAMNGLGSRWRFVAMCEDVERITYLHLASKTFLKSHPDFYFSFSLKKRVFKKMNLFVRVPIQSGAKTLLNLLPSKSHLWNKFLRDKVNDDF